jgi:hypothetical protein
MYNMSAVNCKENGKLLLKGIALPFTGLHFMHFMELSDIITPYEMEVIVYFYSYFMCSF